MEIGDTFELCKRGINDHLQVIISDPRANPDMVVVVALTSTNAGPSSLNKGSSRVDAAQHRTRSRTFPELKLTLVESHGHQLDLRAARRWAE